MAAYGDLTAIHIPKTGNQIAQRRFAAAGRTYHSSGGFFRDGKANIV